MNSEKMYNFFKINSGGKTDINGQKNGWWVELNDSIIESHNQVSHYCGEYQEGKKIGRWDTKIKFNIFDEFQVIGGGEYDLNEMKIGQWVELITNFSQNNQVQYLGFYKKGQKYGQWNTLLRQENDFDIIGGGFYEKGVKIGKWMELSSKNDCKFNHIGEYDKGLKINRWNIIFTKYDTDDYKIIGGGLYNLKGIKHGKWVEIQNEHENFNIVAYIGEYKNGKKIGKWEIIQGSTEMNQYQMIGGGCYDINGLEQGLWTEIEQFSFKFSVISIGKYLEGKKCQKWETMYRLYKEDEFVKLGTGCFDKNGIKQGDWVEIHSNFENHQITYHGFYQDGVKIDKWQTYYQEEGQDDFAIIGGGCFDKNGFKQGKWMELHENFNDDMKISYQGDYLLGKKIGRWDTLQLQDDQYIQNSHNYSRSSSQNYMTPDDSSIDSSSFQGFNPIQNKFQQNFQKDQKMQEDCNVHQEDDGQIIFNSKQFQIIGGGQFDMNEKKDGFWIENNLVNSSYFDQIQSKGNYNQGKKVGNWIIGCFRYIEKKMGGGQYDENGIKQGIWLELQSYQDNYYFDQQDCLINFGEYKDGLKIGRWDTLQLQPQKKLYYQIIGGGFFNQNSIKYGEWVEIVKNCGFSDMITIYKGEYKNGKKFGKWEIKQSSNQDYYKFRPIFGGLYDMDGRKQNLWLEEQCGSSYKLSSKNLIFFGNYRNGQKIGQWDYMDIGEDGSTQIFTDGGLYDENGMKHGMWYLNSKNQFTSKFYSVEYKNGFRINAWKQDLQMINLL
ncbi:unnamed protein product [Paramecium sonneborni]|uniref:Uncharacterized protein n=1 Tax=Paramecium sonneborni TaxID=65129 RepID=A0A8S1QAM3_9CILI|nr:unnamed protein product [Paramecium sonneborni]